MLRFWSLIALLLLTSRVQGAPAPPGTRDILWDRQIYAPAHLQIEIVNTPVEGFAFEPFTACAADAIVRVAFRGAEIFPLGKRLRIVLPLGNGWFLGASEPPRTVICDLSKGVKAEVFLDRDGKVVGGSESFGLFRIDRFTSRPTINPELLPTWYNTSFCMTGHPVHDQCMDKASHPFQWEQSPPPPFPTADVIVTYKSTAMPDRPYVAAYNAVTKRINAVYPGGLFSAARHVVFDPVVSLETVLDDRHKTYILLPYTDIVVDHNQWSRLHPVVVGSEIIAGLPCTDYDLKSGLHSPPIEPAIVCVTKDGVRLKRVQKGVTQIAVSVRYEAVSPDDSVIPDGYERVRGPEDKKNLQRPMWID